MKRRLPPGTRIVLAALCLVLAASTAALAGTAANTRITNTVTVTYDTPLAAGNTLTASVDVTVNLVPAAPTLTLTSTNPASLASIPEGSNVTLTYTLTGNANGPDTYDLSSASVDTSVGAPAITVNGGTTTVTLGGTTLAAAPVAGAGTITVPYDQSDDGIVNDITDGDILVIGGETYTVAAGGVTYNPATPEVMTVALTANISAAAAAATSAGDPVGERITFDVAVTAGALSPPPYSGTHDVTTTATNGADSSAVGPTTITVTRTALVIVKEVSTDGGATFPAGPVSAAPGATLTYRITVTNSGVADASNVVITDPLPPFTSYVAGSAKTDTVAGTTYGAAATGLDDDTAGAPDDGYDFGVTTANEATFSVGALTGGSSVLLFFQVAIQ